MNIVDFIVLGLATVKYMMIFSSLDLPVKMLNLIKKTKSDWLRLLFAKAGMFFDCPICLSVISAGLALLVNSLKPIINILLAISVLGLFLKKQMIDK